MTNCELLLGGKFVTTDRQTPIVAPFDGKVVGTATEGSWPEMDSALGFASKAFDSWRCSTRKERQTLLRRTAALVREREHELVEILTLEVGKPITWSRGEVARTAITFDLAADLLSEDAVEEMPTGFDPRGAGCHTTVERFPIGPVLAITPYNWPYNLAAHKIAPALAAGTTVVLKPSPLAPLSSSRLVRLIHDAGCPAGVLNFVNCDGPTAQRAVLDERTALVSFTGSDKVGWMLKGLAPERKVVLELGGDASVVLLPDANLDWAVPRTVTGAFGYAGQICISVQHVLAHADIYDEVRDRLSAGTRECLSGDPSLPETVCGPLISAIAADRVSAWVAEAEAAGATVLVRGARSGNVVAPTLVENVSRGTNLAENEVFGPVATLSKFETVDEAIDFVNSSRYGIQTGVYTNDDSLSDQFYRDLQIGGVIVNDGPNLRFDNMPYGGVKRSGFGREGVKYAFEEMTEPKVKVVRTIDRP